MTIRMTPAGIGSAAYAMLLSAVLAPRVTKTKAQQRREAAGTDRTHAVRDRDRNGPEWQAMVMQRDAQRHNATARRYRFKSTNIKKLRRIARGALAVE